MSSDCKHSQSLLRDGIMTDRYIADLRTDGYDPLIHCIQNEVGSEEGIYLVRYLSKVLYIEYYIASFFSHTTRITLNDSGIHSPLLGA